MTYNNMITYGNPHGSRGRNGFSVKCGSPPILYVMETRAGDLESAQVLSASADNHRAEDERVGAMEGRDATRLQEMRAQTTAEEEESKRIFEVRKKKERR